MIGCALIGCGYWGSKLQTYIDQNKSFELKYVCNSKSDLDLVWNDPNIHAVVVATPNATHYSIVRSALLHDKNVLSEKPLSLKVTECEELKKLAAKRNLALTVEYTYTFSKALQQAKELVTAGEIGQILGLEMAVRHLGRFKGGSVYWLLGSHMLSVLDMFFSIEDIYFNRTDLVKVNGEVETGAISFQSGQTSGQIVVSLNYLGKETRVIIYGENGTMIYNPLSPPTLQVEKYERVPWTVASKLPRVHNDYSFDEAHNLRYAIAYFRDVIEGRAKSNVDRAVEITRILQTLQEY